MNWTEYLLVSFLVIVLVLVPTLAIVIKRLIELCFKKITGRYKVETEKREKMQHRYSNPDWAFYEKHLGRSVPLGIRKAYETKALADKPVVRVGDEEFLLYPIYADGIAAEGFYPLAQNELGEILFIEKGTYVEPLPLFVCERDGTKRQIASDASAFFYETY